MKKLMVFILMCAGMVFAQGQGITTSVITTPSPSRVQQVFVTQSGTTGGVYYCYRVVAVYNIGMALPSPPTCTNLSAGTLNGSNYNVITWNPPPGGSPTGYWVIRNTTDVFPGTGTYAVNSSVLSSSTVTTNDQSNSLNSFTYAAVPGAIAQFYIDNSDYGVPVVRLVDGNGSIDAQWYQIAITAPGTASNGTLWSAEGNATDAQLATGVTFAPAVLGRQYKVVGMLMQAVGGSAATCTAVAIQDTGGSTVLSVPAATLTSGSMILESGANITFTAFLDPLTLNYGLVIKSTGSTCTTMTSLNYRILFRFL